MTDWSTAEIPPLNGRTAVITGATGGLGYETALALAGAGAVVVLTGRSEAKGRLALQAIRDRFPNASISYENLDLAKLASVADFAARFAAGHTSLDLLINNAGVMALPERQRTAVLMHKYEGLDYRQIGEVLKLSESATKSLLFRAYQTLRERLKEFV